MRTTTLGKILAFDPHNENWVLLVPSLRNGMSDDMPISYSEILDICGLRDALWATRTETDFQWVQELTLTYANHVDFWRSPIFSRMIREYAANSLACSNARCASDYCVHTASLASGNLSHGKEHEWQKQEFLKVVS